MKVLFALLSAATVLCAVAAETMPKATKESMPVAAEATIPVADMAMIDADLKTSTERPPTKVETVSLALKQTPGEPIQLAMPDTQRHTVADFIIHPIIALKARSPATEEDLQPDGRQADGSTTAAPPTWQVLGVSAGQGISSLASWVADRFQSSLQLPSLDPLIASSTTAAPSTTKTPDIVVRVQHKPTTRRPLIALNNANRPYRFGGNGLDYDSEEDYDDHIPHVNTYNNNKRRRYPAANNNFDDEEDEEDEADSEEYDNHPKGSEEEDEEEEEEAPPAPPKKQKKKKQQPQQQRRKKPQKQTVQEDEEEEEDDNNSNANHSGADDDEEEEQEEEVTSQRPNNRRRPLRKNGSQNNFRQSSASSAAKRRGNAQSANRRQPQDVASVESNEDDDNRNFYYADSRPSTKRSQGSSSLRGPQNLFNQIRQFTRVPSPSEVGSIMRRTPSAASKRRQQATLFVNSNGQTVYVAPELVEAGVPVGAAESSQYGFYPPVVMKKRATHRFPQPPLTTAMKLKGQPTQYITIPWNQLGISPPNQLTSLASDLQSEPHILNIPQSAMDAMTAPSRPGSKKRPVITADAVPLLADASLMDIFQPPQIPPSRATPAAGSKPGAVLPNAGTITAKARPATLHATPVVLPQRIRGGTIVEKAPAMDETMEAASADANNGQDESEGMEDEQQQQQQQQEEQSEMRSGGNSNNNNKKNKEFIIVGEDNESGLTRQVQPVYGDARYFHVGAGGEQQPAYFLHRGRFAVRKGHGRSLPQPEESVPAVEVPVQTTVEGAVMPLAATKDASPEILPAEQTLIPVQIVNEMAEEKKVSSVMVDPPQVVMMEGGEMVASAPQVVETVVAAEPAVTETDTPVVVMS